MINFLIGPSGGGKSYEAVVYHVLPALRAGRLVITNLPINREAMIRVEPATAHLLRFVRDRDGVRAFSTVGDYPARNDSQELGPLVVIDECHKALPFGRTDRAVEEWFAEHRHTRSDVLLITQSYGKISAAIRDNVQIVYRVRKAVAFGFSTRYVRKVQDGLRGEIVNTAVRRYERRYFGLYRSHTKGAEGVEGGASDVVPMWRRWPFVGAAIMLPLGVGLMLWKGNIFEAVKPDQVRAAELRRGSPGPRVVEVPKHIAEAAAAQRTLVQAEAARVERVSFAAPAARPVLIEPYGTKGLHYVGRMTFNGRTVHMFLVSSNAMGVSTVTSVDLEAAGYQINMVGECTGWLRYGDTVRPVICDGGQMRYGGGDSVRRGTAEGTPEGGGAAVPAPGPSPGRVS